MELNQTKAVCRACLTEEGIFQSIFLVDSNTEFSLQVSEMLNSFSMIQVIQGDGLTEHICTKCVEKTIKMYLFKLKFEESDLILRARLKKVSLRNNENSINQVKAETAELIVNFGIKTESDNDSPKEILIGDINKFESGSCKSDGGKEMSKNRKEIKIPIDNSVLNKHSKIDKFQYNTFQEMPKENVTSHKITETIKMEELEIKDEPCFQVNCDDFVENANLMPKIENDQNIQVSCDGVDANLSRDPFADMKFDLKNKPFGCDICFEGFSQKSNLRDHMRTHNSTSSNDFLEKSKILTNLQKHTGQISVSCPNSLNLMFDKKNSTGDNTYQFGESKKKITKFQNLTLFKKNHTGKKPFKCDICEKKYSSMQNLIIHNRTHTGEKPFECNMCEKKFIQMLDLTRHKRTHTGEKPFKCDMCEKKFTLMQNLTRHKRTHTGEKPFECDMCEKKFTRMKNLIQHKRTHTAEKPFECDISDKKLKDMQNLITHKRSHTGERLFQCDMCEKKFTRMQNLLSHQRTHTGEKPFECDMCEKKFTRMHNLISHQRTHTGEKPFECDMCGKKFTRMQNSIRHQKTHTGEKPFECDVCDKKFTEIQNLTTHKRIHTGDKRFKCDMCKKKFIRKQELIRHQKIHTDKKPFECDMCEKKFALIQTLIRHKIIHTGEKPFECGV